MERKIDIVEAYQTGYLKGQADALSLLNQYCIFAAKDIPEVVSEVVQLQTKCAKLEIKLLEMQNV